MEIKLTADEPIAPFIEQRLQAAAQDYLNAHPVRDMQGNTFRARIEVADHGRWILMVTDGQHAAVEPDPGQTRTHLWMRFTESGLRRSQSGEIRQLNVIRMIYGDARRFAALQKLSGRVDLSLKEGKDRYPFTLIFNDVESPQVTIRISYDDFCNLIEGKTAGTKLFFTGRLRPKGNMALLMKLQTVL